MKCLLMFPHTGKTLEANSIPQAAHRAVSHTDVQPWLMFPPQGRARSLQTACPLQLWTLRWTPPSVVLISPWTPPET